MNEDKKTESVPAFAAVPVRALSDQRLSASHWRVLATIAYHDRFGANGVGCIAGARTLVAKATVHATNLARLVQDLEDWGYIKSERSLLDKRRRTYRLIYKDNPAMVGETTNKQSEEVNEAPSDALPSPSIVGQSTNQNAEIVGVDFQIAEQEQSDIERNILDETLGLKNPAKQRRMPQVLTKAALADTTSFRGGKARRVLTDPELLERELEDTHHILANRIDRAFPGKKGIGWTTLLEWMDGDIVKFNSTRAMQLQGTLTDELLVDMVMGLPRRRDAR